MLSRGPRATEKIDAVVGSLGDCAVLGDDAPAAILIPEAFEKPPFRHHALQLHVVNPEHVDSELWAIVQGRGLGTVDIAGGVAAVGDGWSRLGEDNPVGLDDVGAGAWFGLVPVVTRSPGFSVLCC